MAHYKITDGIALAGDISIGAGVTLGEGVHGATITVGTEAGNAIVVSVQLKDAHGDDLAVRGSLMAYLSDDANGDSVAGTAPDTVAIATDGLAIPLVAGKCWLLTSESDGDIALSIGEDGVDTWYLILVIPTTGKLVASGAITFA